MLITCRSRARVPALCLTALVSCSAPDDRILGTRAPVPPGEVAPQLPLFEAAAPTAVVAKVKQLLLGLPPTADEVAAVTPPGGAPGVDRAALARLIDGWMRAPQFRDAMLGFFRQAFQQDQVLPDSILDQMPSGMPSAMMVQNLQDSFPRTAWMLVSEDRPLHEAITTGRFMMTPALLALYGYMDNLHVDDASQRTGQILRDNPGFFFAVTPARVPLEQTLDPAHPNYMFWHNPTVLPATAPPECAASPRVYDRSTAALWNLMFGVLSANAAQQKPGPCLISYSVKPQIAAADYATWRPVTLRQPRPGEAPTPFYDLLALRNADEIVYRIPRRGFFTTPAFFANWPTNASNLARVTMNQTLIVALGRSFDGQDNTVPVMDSGVDAQHAGPGTPCYACHATLDPMRQTLRQTYTLAYHEQVDPAQRRTPGVFTFDGVSRPVRDLPDLAAALAQHPRFGVAWAGKVCDWATSTVCREDDPEIQRVAQAFAASNYNFKALVREMLSSPLVTAAADTRTFGAQGVTVSVARREQLCDALAQRLGLDDPCGLSNAPGLTSTQRQLQGYAVMIPAAGYSRGAEHAVLPSDPSLFFRAATEDLCQLVADLVVDAGAAPRYGSGRLDAALDDLVQTVMGLPPTDRRAAAARRILAGHHADAVAAGATPTDALRSTFTLACAAPGSVALGL